MPRIKKNKMGYYMPTTEETIAYRWCINNGIYISPFANGEGAWYIDIKLNNKVSRSPDTYGGVTIWIKLYEFYKYYYNKYAHKI
jgi:hypothetical protein|tara:strand:- start:1264 stop:1515 length:252 start_codon:yes stop_codon:yes gene_type:complete